MFSLVIGGGYSSYFIVSNMDMVLVYFLSSNLVSSVGCFVDDGALRHLAYERFVQSILGGIGRHDYGM